MKGLIAATLKLLGKSSFFTTEWQMRQCVLVPFIFYLKANIEKVIFQKLD